MSDRRPAALRRSAVLGGLCVLLLGQGVVSKSVEGWLEDLEHSDPSVRLEAVEHLSSMDTEFERIATALVGLHDDPDPEVRLAVAEGMLEVIAAGELPLDMDRYLGRVLSAMESVAARSEVEIDLRMRAIESLGYIGPDRDDPEPHDIELGAAEALVQLLTDEDPMVRAGSAWSLIDLGLSLPEAVSALAGMITAHDLDPSARGDAIAAAGYLVDWEDDEGIEVLIDQAASALAEALQDTDGTLRLDAAESLLALDRRVPAALSALAEAAKNGDADVQVRAIKTAASLEAQPPGFPELLEEALGSPLTSVRLAAAAGLLEARGPSTDLLDAILGALRDPDEVHREKARALLKRVDRPALVAELAELAESPVDSVRLDAISGLAAVDVESAERTAALLFSLANGRSADERAIAAEGLGQPPLASDNEVVVAALAGALASDSSPSVRLAAARSLAASPGASLALEQVVDDLLLAAKDTQTEVRAEVVVVLGRVRSDERAEPTLIEALGDEDAAVRIAAAAHFEETRYAEPADRAALFAALTAAAADAEGEVRGLALSALNRYWPFDTSSAADAVIGALADRDAKARTAAIAALWILPENEVAHAKGLLILALENENERVREESLRALKPMRLTEEELQGLLEVFADSSAPVRRAAIEVLGPLLPNHETLVLNELLDDEDSGVAVAAAAELALRGLESDAVEESLVRALASDNRTTRASAAEGLGHLEAPDAESVALLGLALRDPDSEVRRAAISSLRELGPAAAPALESLVATLDGEEAYLAESAVRLVGRLYGPTAELAVLVTRALGSESADVRMAAVETVALVDPERALPDSNRLLLAAAKDEDPRVRASALEALEGAAAEDEGVVAALVAALDEEDAAARGAAAGSLGQTGAAATPAVPRLVEMVFEDANDWAARSAARALRDLGRQDEIIEPLLERLSGAEPGRRKRWISLIGELDDDSRLLDELAAALGDDDVETRLAAAEGLRWYRGQSPAVFTGLTAAVRDPDARVQEAALAAFDRYSLKLLPQALVAPLVEALVEILGSPAGPIRAAAADVLAALGESAREAAQSLAAGAKDEDPAARQSAVAAYLKVGGDPGELASILVAAPGEASRERRLELARQLGGFPAETVGIVDRLRELLSDPAAEVRAEAARSLEHLGPGADSAGPALLEGIADESSEVRAATVAALARVRPRDEATVQALAQALADPVAAVRQKAATALWVSSENIAAAAPRLIVALKDPSEPVRQAAAQALGSVRTEESTRALRSAMVDRSDAVRQAAIESLGEHQEVAAKATPQLARILTDGDQDSYLRAAAAATLAEIGEQAERAAPALRRALKDPSPEVREAVARAIASVWPTPEGYRLLIGRLAEEKVDSVRVAVAEALRFAHSPDSGIVAVLIASTREANPRVRSAAIDALGNVGGFHEEILPALVGAVQDADPRVRRAAAEALGRFEGDFEPAIDDLASLTEDPDSWVRATAAEALGETGTDAEKAVLALAAALGDVEESVRLDAAIALARLNVPAGPAGGPLRTALEDPSEKVRRAAAIALGKRGLEAEAVLPILAELVGVEEENRLYPLRDVRLSAANAIVQVAVRARTETRIEQVAALRSSLEVLEKEPRLASQAQSTRLALDYLELAQTSDLGNEIEARFEDVDLPAGAEVVEALVDGKPLVGAEIEIEDGVVLLRGEKGSLTDGVHSLLLRVKTAVRETVIDPIVFWKERERLRKYRRRDYNKWAVVIGVGDYSEDDSGLGNLPAAPRQAKEVGDYFGQLGYEVEYFLDTERSFSRADLDSFLFNELNPKMDPTRDVLVFYFGGHGVTRTNMLGLKKGYLLPDTYDPDNVETTAISMVDHVAGIYSDNLKAKHILFAIDACMSDVGLRGGDVPSEDELKEFTDLADLEVLTKGVGRSILTAGRDGQPAIDLNEGIFTEALLAGLQGDSDRDENGIVELNELESYVRRRVAARAKAIDREQVPDRFDIKPVEGGGEYVHLYRAPPP